MRFLLFLVLVSNLSAQEFRSIETLRSEKDIWFFNSHYERTTLTGSLIVPRDGYAIIEFQDPAHPDGFAGGVYCQLDKPIKEWVITGPVTFADHVPFITFKAKRGTEYHWKCLGWSWRKGMKGVNVPMPKTQK